MWIDLIGPEQFLRYKRQNMEMINF